MKNSQIRIISAMVVLNVILALIGPWWLPLLSCFVLSGLFVRGGANAFWMGALTLTGVWLGCAATRGSIDDFALTQQVGDLIKTGIPVISSFPGTFLVFLILTIQGIVLGGLAALAGTKLRG